MRHNLFKKIGCVVGKPSDDRDQLQTELQSFLEKLTIIKDKVCTCWAYENFAVASQWRRHKHRSNQGTKCPSPAHDANSGMSQEPRQARLTRADWAQPAEKRTLVERENQCACTLATQTPELLQETCSSRTCRKAALCLPLGREGEEWRKGITAGRVEPITKGKEKEQSPGGTLSKRAVLSIRRMRIARLRTHFYHERRTYRIIAMIPFPPSFVFVSFIYLFLFFMLKIQPRTSGRPKRKETRPNVGKRAKKTRRTIEGRTRPKEYEADSLVHVAEGSVGYHEVYPSTWYTTLLP